MAPLDKKDSARALFELDMFDTESSLPASKKPRTARHGIQTASQSSTAEARKSATLLGMPVELRLQIYDLLLISCFDRSRNPSWAVANSCQNKVMLHVTQGPRYRTLELAILQTCQQIYAEAIHVLYSQNILNFSSPEQMFGLLSRARPTHIRLIRSLDIRVPWSADLDSWIMLLDRLAKEAAGLRSIDIFWGANTEFRMHLVKGAKERGLGDNVLFAQALARIQGLDRLKLTGYYAKHWPSYLEDKMGATEVRAKRGHCVAALDDEDPVTQDWARKFNARCMPSFIEYQNGTDDLVP